MTAKQERAMIEANIKLLNHNEELTFENDRLNNKLKRVEEKLEKAVDNSGVENIIKTIDECLLIIGE